MHLQKNITKLNDRVLRVACRPAGRPEVPATLAVPEPDRFRPVTLTAEGKTELYRDECLTVRIVQDGRPLLADNLQIEWQNGATRRSWRPGERDDENLGGPPLSLDVLQNELVAQGIAPYDPMAGMNAYRRNVFTLIDPLRQSFRDEFKIYDPAAWKDEFYRFLEGRPPEIFPAWPDKMTEDLKTLRCLMPGYLSRSGLSLILDDSPAWDPEKQWLADSAQSESQVLYAVHYGSDFKLGLSLLTELLGPIAPLPEWALGVWFSVYREMTAQDYQQLKADFDRHDCPLDVIVVDTDWHTHFWHGFDWNRERFPKPEAFAAWLRQAGLHAAFNVHPGFLPLDDSQLSSFLKTCGLQPAPQPKETAYQRGNIGCHPVDLRESRQAEAWFEIFHCPVEQQGCDLWWVDDTRRENALWLGELYYRFGQRDKGEKIPVLMRNFGLGAHRTTLLFTGDTYSQWSVLDQEVLLTPLCANSLMGWVSHDIGGFNADRASTVEKSAFEAIIELGNEKGHLTFEEIDERLPQNISIREVEKLFEELDRLNIPVFEQEGEYASENDEPPAKHEPSPFGDDQEEPAQANMKAAKINQPPTDLMVRWTQFGCLSPVLRFHSNHGIREPWAFGDEALRIMRAFLHLRRGLHPYLVQLAEEARQCGVGPCRPMYYEFPEEDEAYQHPRQFMLGPALLVCPVSREDGCVRTWLPPGRWHHAFENRMVIGPAMIEEQVPLELMPLWTREGYEIPISIYRQGSAPQAAVFAPPLGIPLAAALGANPYSEQ